MEWEEYVSSLLLAGKEYENMAVSMNDGKTLSEIPPIITASVYMLEKMETKKSRLNVLVFPEKVQSFFFFVSMKLFHSISSGEIQSSYNPSDFVPGERLKVGNAIVEFVELEEREGHINIKIRVAGGMTNSLPIEYCPIFQRVKTKRGLSKWPTYFKERKKALGAMNPDSSISKKLSYVSDMKTHMKNSVFIMTSITAAKEQILKSSINGKDISKIFYIGQTNYEGIISNISPGQMTGNPAAVLASDLYSIIATVENKHSIQSIIIDGSNMNVFSSQLDALDELIRLNIPIVCVTDTANSFEMEGLSERGFNIWRWNDESLTGQLYDTVPLPMDNRTKYCATHSVTYLQTDGNLISDTMRRLSGHRKETETQSPKVMKLYEKLSSLTFSALRAIIPLSDKDKDFARFSLDECEELLSAESAFLDERSISDYSTAIETLRQVYGTGYCFNKIDALKQYIKEHEDENIILVIPEGASKETVNQYWNSWKLQHFIKNKIWIKYPSEYYAYLGMDNDVTIICGWFTRAIMRKVIYSFNTWKYIVLLYDYENRWKAYSSRKWSNALRNSDNKRIIETAFSSDTTPITTVRFAHNTLPLEPDTPDELSEIELILRENKYRQYANGGLHAGNDMVAAIPVNFVGGYLAFYRPGHKVISATTIITSDADKIELKLPTELHTGDFIVLREADRDLIREIADIILSNSGKNNYRELASKWREAMQIELLFCSEEDFIEKVKAAGCTKGSATIRRWIDDDDVIAPQSKEDLRILANVTENETLIEMLDIVFEAAQEVRKAHVLAGRKLSEQLRIKLAEELKKYGGIDPYNFWEPFDIEVEGIGNVKVLKIIDIGSEIQVASTDTNRLIEE